MTPISIKTPALIKALCEEEGKCWIWTGARDGHGRPQMRHEGKTVYVRRILRGMIDKTPVDDEMRVAATCGCRLCVSPHCSVITTKGGAMKMAAERGVFNTADRNRRVAAAKRAKSRITDETVDRIRAAEGPASRISSAEGISESHVKAIRRGTARRDYTSPFAGLMA